MLFLNRLRGSFVWLKTVPSKKIPIKRIRCTSDKTIISNNTQRGFSLVETLLALSCLLLVLNNMYSFHTQISKSVHRAQQQLFLNWMLADLAAQLQLYNDDYQQIISQHNTIQLNVSANHNRDCSPFCAQFDALAELTQQWQQNWQHSSLIKLAQLNAHIKKQQGLLYLVFDYRDTMGGVALQLRQPLS